MSDAEQWLQSIAAHSAGVGAASTVAMLCLKLASSRILTSQDIEELRQAALIGFDGAQEKWQIPEPENCKLEKLRNSLDDLWQAASVAAEGGVKPSA